MFDTYGFVMNWDLSWYREVSELHVSELGKQTMRVNCRSVGLHAGVKSAELCPGILIGYMFLFLGMVLSCFTYAQF